MQIQHLTEEPTVAITPTSSTQQREQMPPSLDTVSEAAAMQTYAELEAIQSETLSSETTASQKSATSIEVTLTKMQQQWQYCVKLNNVVFAMVLQSTIFMIIGLVGHIMHVQMMSHLHSHYYQGAPLRDSSSPSR